MQTFDLSDVESMESLGSRLAKICPAGRRIYFQGDLGAGKTTLVRGFLRGLGFNQPVKSPTYTLIEPYLFDGYEVYHFDLYRLENTEDLESTGFREYFTDKTICLVEWPEKAQGLLYRPDILARIEVLESSRRVCLVSETPAGHSLLQTLH